MASHMSSMCCQLPAYPRHGSPDGKPLMGSSGGPCLSRAGGGGWSLGTRAMVATAPPLGSLAHCLTALIGEWFSLYPLGMSNCVLQRREKQNRIYWVLYVYLSSLRGPVWPWFARLLVASDKQSNSRSSPSLFPGSSPLITTEPWINKGSYIFLFADITLCGTSTKISNHMFLFLWLYLFCTTAR